MYTLQKGPSDRPLGNFTVPFKGTWTTLPSHLLPQDAVQDSLNVTLRNGKLKARAGLVLHNRANLGHQVLGSFISIDTLNQKVPFAATRSQLYYYTGVDWKDITNFIAFSNGVEAIRFTNIQVGTSVYVIVANGVDPLRQVQQVDYLLKEIPPHSGTIPVLTDICTSFSRVVGILPPYTVAWCDVVNDQYINFTNWPALNQAILSDTEDSLVAIKPLGTLGIALYKEGNIFVGTAQAGSNAAAFRFEHRGEYEGPASSAAVINVDGTHIRMTPSGRVGLFDGTRHAWIADGVWPFLQNDIDPTQTSRIFGVYNYQTAEIIFWYPRVSDSNGMCTGILIIDMPYPRAGIADYSYFLGSTNFCCTAGLSVRAYQNKQTPLVFSAEVHPEPEADSFRSYRLDKDVNSDNGFDFPCSFTTGLVKPSPGEDGSDIFTGVAEVYCTRGDSTAGTVDVSLVTSSGLESNGTLGKSTTLDLTVSPINQFVPFAETGQFLGLSFSWLSKDKFEFKGADLYGRSMV